MTKEKTSWRGESLLLAAFGLGLAGYFGLYFACADYADAGDNVPFYIVNYRIGSHSLHRLAPFFEPANRIDEAYLRRRGGVVP
jgi:hypothetical protein